MKKMLLTTILMAAQIATANSNNYVIKLDWANQKTLSDNVVMMCDDTYISEIVLVVPGVAGKDFYVEMGVGITHGVVTSGCEVKMKQLEGSAVYKINGHGGGCTIRVDKARRNFKEKQQSATYEISDAC